MSEQEIKRAMLDSIHYEEIMKVYGITFNQYRYLRKKLLTDEERANTKTYYKERATVRETVESSIVFKANPLLSELIKIQMYRN